MKTKTLSVCLILFILLMFAANLNNVKASPTYEDFTTFTEVDTNNHLSKTAHHVDHKGYRNEDCYLYKDYGANYFGDFTHLVDIKIVTQGDTNYGISAFWMLSVDTVDDYCGIKTANKTAIAVWAQGYRYGGGTYFLLCEAYGGTNYASTALYIGTGNLGTQYYAKIVKSGTSLTFYLYTDSARTNLFGSISLTLHADHQCRYIFAGNTYNDGTDTEKWVDVDIDNLDLQKKEWFLSETWQTTIYVWKWFLGEAWLLINIYVKAIFAKPYGIYTIDVFAVLLFFGFTIFIFLFLINRKERT